MAAGLTDHVWSLSEWIRFPVVRHSHSQLPDQVGGVLDLGPRDVEVRAGAEHLRSQGGDEHAAFAEPRGDLGGGAQGGIDGDPDEVRLDGPRFEAQAVGLLDGAGEDLGVVVVLGQALDVVVERVEGRRRRGCPPAASRRRAACAGDAPPGSPRRCRPGPSRPARPGPWRSRPRPCRSAGPTRVAATPEATTAFNSRAPSRCIASPRSRAQEAISATLAIGRMRPPPRLCVFSRQTRRVRT